MILEVEITISKDKYGTSLARTEIKLDSDSIDPTSLQHLVAGMVQSTLDRAENKLEERQQVALPKEATRAED